MTPPMHLTPALERIANELATLGPAASCDDLGKLLAAPVTFDDVRGFVRFDEETYVRALVFKNGGAELRVSSWRPGQSTSLHGHGASACAFRVIRGAAMEIVLGERDRVWPPGSVVAETSGRVHQVINLGPDPLLTLHAYAPPLPEGAQTTPRGRHVVIAGGGFAAIAVAYHVLRRCSADVRVHVIEAGPWIGRGIAYGVESELFRLNVPASKMSLDPDVPDDFVRFAGAESTPAAFLSRALYGRYVADRLAAALRGSAGRMRVWRDEAVAVTEREVVLRSGKTLPADAVVLATGLTPRMTHARWSGEVVDAWDECALATLPRRGSILLIGAGLSALDVVAFLEAQRFEGDVTLVSRHGLLPLPHEEPFRAVRPLTGDDVAGAPREIRALVRWIRERIAGAPDLPWQRAVDQLRPHVTALYRSMSDRDRARFARHARPYWDVVRHRAPVDALARVDALASQGRLRRIAGRARVLTSTAPRGSGVDVEIQRRSGERSVERFDAVVRCIGPALDVADAETPLLRSLLDGGFARVASAGLGVETAIDGRLVDARGTPSARIFGIGAVRRASHWETTSVPDIAAHAHQLARLLA